MKAFAAALVAVAVLCAIDFEYKDGLYTRSSGKRRQVC
jgi:hypothetical protein